MTPTQVMRPGILVALKSTLSGGVRYTRQDLEDDGTVARWETTRVMENPDEHTKAVQVRGLVQAAIRRLCVPTNFGLICPLDREAELDLAIAAARSAVDAWNTKAEHTVVTVNVIKGRIADNDEEAMRSLLAEATDLLNQMDQGLAKADVAAIRSAANKARQLTEIMDDKAAESVSDALKAARQAARQIVRRVADEGVTAEQVVQTVSRETFDKARFSFLDQAESELEALPQVDQQRMAEIEAYRDTIIVPRKPRKGQEATQVPEDTDEAPEAAQEATPVTPEVEPVEAPVEEPVLVSSSSAWDDFEFDGRKL